MPTAVSAPGKVLFSGGYLVLDQQYTGLVFGLSARIHVLITAYDTIHDQIVVRSPQFINAVWAYKYSILDKERGIVVSQVIDGASEDSFSNCFVEMTLMYALNYIVSLSTNNTLPPPCQIVILADTDYYSHIPHPLPAYPDFQFFNVSLSSVHKTGLGSSAALVTALSAALLNHYVPSFDFNKIIYRTKLHNFAQAAHCAAQGKVGSGFDVAAAVYGTCIYRRFSPSILTSLGEPGTSYFARRLHTLVEDIEEKFWDVEIQNMSTLLPVGWALIMCDVDCGSATVSMVKKVLDWRVENPGASDMVWGELQQLQKILIVQLKDGDAQGVEKTLGSIRHQLKLMSAVSGVPVEPVEQTELLNSIKMNVKGVIGGVVPGAGGYDAVALLVRDHESMLDELTTFLEDWSVQKGGNFRILDAREESEGTRIENFERYITTRTTARV